MLLAMLGDWMRVHGRSIFGATMSEFSPPLDGRFTQRGNRLYLHLFAWPYVHLHLDGLKDRIIYAQLLNDGSVILFAEGDDPFARVSDLVAARREETKTVSFRLPVQRPDVLVPVIEFFLRDERHQVGRFAHLTELADSRRIAPSLPCHLRHVVSFGIGR